MKALDALKKRLKEIKLLEDTIAIINWDNETKAPSKAVDAASEKISYLSQLIHQKMSSKSFEDVLLKARDSDIQDEVDKRIVEKTYIKYKKTSCLSKELVGRLSYLCSIGPAIWAQSRKEENYDKFKKTLESLIKTNLEVTDASRGSLSRYDYLLNEYEEGLTTKDVDRLFNPLRDYIINFLSRKKTDIKDDFLYKSFDIDKQKKLNECVLKGLLFDLDRGTTAESSHPFTTTLGPDDIRITTKYQENSITSALFSTIHETGHALYEQGSSSKRLYNSILSGGTSMGIHESQSRLYENIIGRSPEFWHYYYPKLQKLFPTFKTINERDFLRAVNNVNPSLIRVEADEVTYNLHIMLRYEMEKAIINEEVGVDDLPIMWNSLVEKYFNLKVDKISNGVLQDIHWSFASFGYFPTYALGNLYSAMIMNKVKEDNKDVLSDIKKGDFSTLNNALYDKVWQYGQLYAPKDLIKKITNQELSEKPFIDYLEEKYTSLDIIK